MSFCLNKGTTFVTVPSMLLMSHERQRNAATDIFKEGGRSRWRTFGVALQAL
jgi:hypothetical protein